MVRWLGLALLMGAGCTSGKTDTTDSGDTGDTGSGFDEARLTAATAAIDGYESWNQTAQWMGIHESGGAHGAYVQMWYNQASYDTIVAAAGEDLPVGSAVVKQGYNDVAGSDLRNLTVMVKDDQGWFWASWNSDGDVLMAGEPDFCVSCHTPGQDFVLSETW